MDMELKDGELLEVSKKKVQREPMPPWNMVGNGMSNRVGASMDFIEICAELNQAELKLFKFFLGICIIIMLDIRRMRLMLWFLLKVNGIPLI